MPVWVFCAGEAIRHGGDNRCGGYRIPWSVVLIPLLQLQVYEYDDEGRAKPATCQVAAFIV